MALRLYFRNLYGNQETKARLGKAIDEGTVPHAFLIGGPEGSGKRTLAREIAAALNCEGYADSLPCCNCNNCRRIYESNFPDIKILKKPEDKATLGVDRIKDFREDMFLSSTESEHKIYVIEDAHTMTPEAQNALLKVLEEPPRGVFIILLAAECDKILTTIKSRTQYIAMSRFTTDELSELVTRKSSDAKEERRLNPRKFAETLLSADGRLGTALLLFDKKLSEKNAEERDEVMEIVTALQPRHSFSDLYKALSSLPKKRRELMISIENVITAIRDLVLSERGADSELLFFTSREECVKIASDIGIKRLLCAEEALLEAHELVSKNAAIGGVISALLPKLKCGNTPSRI